MKQNVRLLTTAKIEVQKFRNGIQTDEIANLTSRSDGIVVALAGTPAGQKFKRCDERLLHLSVASLSSQLTLHLTDDVMMGMLKIAHVLEERMNDDTHCLTKTAGLHVRAVRQP